MTWAKVTLNVQGVVAGTGNAPSSGTWGPTTVTTASPWRSSARTESPSMASQGWPRVAVTVRPTGTEGFGSQPGSDPYAVDLPDAAAGATTTAPTSAATTRGTATTARHRPGPMARARLETGAAVSCGRRDVSGGAGSGPRGP